MQTANAVNNREDALIDGMPRLIQAGMGIHISGAKLANATSRLGALGVVSGAGLRHIVVEEIRRGDEQAIALAKTFPFTRYVDELLAFAPAGTRHDAPVPVDNPNVDVGDLPRRLSTISSYIEVRRAQSGHRGKVGINVMWKAALTALPTIYGAMLAGVDVLLCGAGVPMELPDIVRRLRDGQDLAYAPLSGTGTNAILRLQGDAAAEVLGTFEPPKLIPILSNYAFARRVLDVWNREYDGARPFAFVLENHRAGGHNAPPRNKESFTATDELESYFDKVLALGIPIYVAGDFPAGGKRGDFEYWRNRGAYGLQIGSRFALCRESGMREDLRHRVLEGNRDGAQKVQTSAHFSPTGYPIKYVPLSGTLSDDVVYQSRERVCNRLYLTQSHFETQPDGSVRESYICPAMPVKAYLKNGGEESETEGRVCLCNALFSAAGIYDDIEAPIVTLGESGERIVRDLSARQVIEEVLSPQYVARAEIEYSMNS